MYIYLFLCLLEMFALLHIAGMDYEMHKFNVYFVYTRIALLLMYMYNFIYINRIYCVVRTLSSIFFSCELH